MPFADRYTFEARFVPFVVVASPPIVTAICCAGSNPGLAIGGVVVACIVIAGSQLARDPGKRLEPELWASWDGAPTTQMLRFRGAENQAEVDRRHVTVEKVTGRPMPTRDVEENDPDLADSQYEAAVGTLRELTRDRKDFHLVAAENANYGFRRNLLGLRPFGIVAALATLVASVAIVLFSDTSPDDRFLTAGVPALWALLVLLALVGIVTRSWVRVAADAYAERLFGAAEVLARG